MYDTRLADIDLSLEGLLTKTTEYDIYRYYIGDNFKLGRVMSSPLREDKTPSFSIFKSSKSGSLLFKDQATGDTGNCIQFVMLKENLSYRQAVIRIMKDTVSSNLTMSTKGIEIKEDYKDTSSIISIYKRNFNTTDDIYWNQYSITREDLKEYNVLPIHSYLINGIDSSWSNSNINPGYAYLIFNKIKIYKPLADKKFKWVSNCSSYDLQGLEQLKYSSDTLIITKSLKDVIILNKLGYNAIAASSENTDIPKNIIDHLKSRYSNIIIFYDNDEAGKIGANKIATKNNFKTIFIPDQTTKDISDYTKAYGLEKSKELLIQLINESTNTNN